METKNYAEISAYISSEVRLTDFLPITHTFSIFKHTHTHTHIYIVLRIFGVKIRDKIYDDYFLFPCCSTETAT